jgi:hypothetical protein
MPASLDIVWRLHTDINRWPSWQHSIDTAHLDGPFQDGAAFTWTTFGLNIASTVYQVEPTHRTLWGGPSDGISGIHSWTFTDDIGSVMVTTEESWSGTRVEANTAELQAALDGSLTSWLGLLADAAQLTKAAS